MAVSKNRQFAKIANDVTTNGTLAASAISSDVDLGGGTTVYATLDQLPRSGNTSGDTAFVTATSRFYIWNGIGWFNVAVVNASPTITNAPNATYNLFANGSPTIITLAATDSDGDTLTWSYTASDASGKATITQDSAVFTITPLTDIADTSFTIDFEVTDGINVSTASSTVNIDNRSPVIGTAPAATYALATDGSPTIITLAATDPDGGSITWTYADSGLTDQATITQSSNEFTITPNSTAAAYADFTLTFTASDSIESTSTDATTFSLTFTLLADEWSDTVLSVGTSSTNSLDNQTFIDRSTNAWGSAANTYGTSYSQTAFHPYLDNWSVEFDGNGGTSGSGLDFGNDSTFALGTGDFTMEFWANLTSNAGPPLDWRPDQTNGNYPLASYTGSQFTWHTNGSTRITGTSSPAINQWHHVAVVRNSGTTTLYVDGNSEGNWSDTTNYLIGKARVGLNAFSGGADLDGYLSNVRVVKGTAIYTSNFTPPTEKLTAVSGTILLTCQDSRFKDNSTNGWTPTITNDPKISAFNPFGQESEYALGENKGSVSFTTTDGIDLKVRSSGTASTWTIEFWYKFDPNSTINANHYLFDARGTAGSQTAGSLYLYRTNTSNNYNDGSNWSFDDILNDGTWHWFTMVSDGTNRAIWIDGTRIAALGGTRTVGTHLWINSRNTNQYHNDCEYSDFRLSSNARYATSSTTITIPTSPVGTDGNTTAYYPFDNAGIFDKTGNNTLTLAGNTSTSTTKTKYADTAMYFNGTSDYLTTTFPALGTGDFTIEFWINPSTINSAFKALFDTRTSNANNPLVWIRDSNVIYYYTNSADAIIGTTTLATNTWYHVAACRSSGTTKLFLNGTQQGSNYTDNTSYTADILVIGQRFNLVATPWYHGYMENFQILKDVAKYTANFTPPTQEQGRVYQASS